MVAAVRWKYMACKFVRFLTYTKTKFSTLTLLETRTKLELKCVPQSFVGSLLGSFRPAFGYFLSLSFLKWRIVRIENVRLNILIVNLFMHSIIKDRMRLFWVLFLLGVTMFCMCVEWMRKKRMARWENNIMGHKYVFSVLYLLLYENFVFLKLRVRLFPFHQVSRNAYYL